MSDIYTKPCITVTCFGADPFEITFIDFALHEIQEVDLAIEIAKDHFLPYDGGQYEANEDAHPQFYREYLCFDRPALKAQLEEI